MVASRSVSNASSDIVPPIQPTIHALQRQVGFLLVPVRVLPLLSSASRAFSARS